MAAVITTHTSQHDTTYSSGDPLTGGGWSIPVPSGLASGDVWVIAFETDHASITNLSLSGFTPVSNIVTTDWPCGRAWYKVAGASETAANITASGPAGSTFAWEAFYTSARVTGANTTTPLDTHSEVAYSGGAETSVDPANMTVASNGSLAIGYMGVAASETVSSPTGSTELFNHSDNWTGGSIVYQAVNAGTFNPGAWGCSNASGGRFAQWFVIAPAAAATGKVQRFMMMGVS